MLNPVSIIKKKRDGHILSPTEIDFFVRNYTEEKIPDYQMSSFLMSIYFRGMNRKETASLTQSMLHSGTKLNLEKVKKTKIDKHSTGGVGDKTSFLLAPMLSCLGVAVPMISGRGLGHTGGTVDKLESIPGFQTVQSLDRFQELVRTIGVAMIAQSPEIAPADRRIYALRDVTATVDCIPLIVASIMSKKLAEDFDGLVLDVKTGNGAFMKDIKHARSLAKALIETAHAAGRSVRAIISDMSQPLGRAAGNSIEINECVAFLRRGPRDPEADPRLFQLTLELGAEMLVMARAHEKKKISLVQAKQELRSALLSGRAYGKFLEMVSMQGGNTVILDAGLPLAPVQIEWKAEKNVFIQEMQTENIGMILVEMGGGRKKTGDKIDHQVGLYFEKGLGDRVKVGETIVRIYARDTNSGKDTLIALKEAIRLGRKKVKVPALIRERI